MEKKELRDISAYLVEGITEIEIRYNTNNHTVELLRACKMLENYSLKVNRNLRLSNIKLSLNLNDETDKDLMRIVSATDWIGEFLPNYRKEIEYSIKMQSEKTPKPNRVLIIESLLHEINTIICTDSTLEQWEQLMINEELTEPIRIKKGVQIKAFAYFYDSLKNKIGFTITDKKTEQLKVFRHEGKLIKACQITQGRKNYKSNYFDSTEIDKILK